MCEPDRPVLFSEGHVIMDDQRWNRERNRKVIVSSGSESRGNWKFLAVGGHTRGVRFDCW